MGEDLAVIEEEIRFHQKRIAEIKEAPEAVGLSVTTLDRFEIAVHRVRIDELLPRYWRAAGI